MMTAAAGWVGLVCAGWLAVFQLGLALGAPYGFLAWGGAEPGRLSPLRRGMSFLSCGLMALFVLAFGQALGLWAVLGDGRLVWIFAAGAALFALSTLGNSVSASRWERLHGVPLALALTMSCALCALAALRPA